MTIGYFGTDIVFETSANKVLTFNDFKHTAASTIEKHKIIGKKPLSEYCGQELNTVNFTINLNAGLGVKPQDIIDKLNTICEQGIAETLIIGGKTIGIDKFLIVDVSTAYDVVYNNGFLYSAKIDLSLEEYISDTSLNISKNANDKSADYYSIPRVDTASAQNAVSKIGNTYDSTVTLAVMQPFMSEIVGDLYR